jgi:hypothetical protein
VTIPLEKSNFSLKFQETILIGGSCPGDCEWVTSLFIGARHHNTPKRIRTEKNAIKPGYIGQQLAKWPNVIALDVFCLWYLELSNRILGFVLLLPLV